MAAQQSSDAVGGGKETTRQMRWLLAGASAGLAVDLSLYPLDTIKVLRLFLFLVFFCSNFLSLPPPSPLRSLCWLSICYSFGFLKISIKIFSNNCRNSLRLYLDNVMPNTSYMINPISFRPGCKAKPGSGHRAVSATFTEGHRR